MVGRKQVRGREPLLMSSFDAVAPSFDHHRALPDGVADTIRAAMLSALASPGDEASSTRPSLLDLGAGSGRIGWPFVAAGDEYVAVDLSGGMLRVFADRCVGGRRAVLVQADGCALPFAAAIFDAVLLVAVFGDLPDWRRLVDEARRVLRPHGSVVLGRTVTPDDGVDERMKQQLDILLPERMTRNRRRNGRAEAAQYLTAIASATTELVAASWHTKRSPRAFLDRHAGGVRFSRLPLAVRDDALRALARWAEAQFGTLDAEIAETHRFEIQLFRLKGD
jgi:ubiquinone/menaquinone biosynthesis C-methylase UbiE